MSIVHPINESDPSQNARSNRVENNAVQNSSKQALEGLVADIGRVESFQLRSFLREYVFGQSLQDDALALTIMMSMDPMTLGGMMEDIMASLKTMFNLSTSQIDVNLIGFISKFKQLPDDWKDNHPSQMRVLKLALEDLQNHQNTTMQNLARDMLQSLGTRGTMETMPISEQGSITENPASFQAELQALQLQAIEAPTGQLAPTVAAPLSFSGESGDAFSTGNVRSALPQVASSEDGMVKVDVSNTLAEVSMHTEFGAAAYTSATIDPDGRVHQAGIVELNGLHMVLSPLVAALISSLVSKRIQENRAKVAIVCDSVVCLDGMERTDSIYVVDVSKDLSTQTFVNIYQDLIDRGYHRIMSIHVSPLLDKTYRIAKEAAKDVTDADIKVVNSHANGLGLGILIREIKEAIEHNFSPTEIGSLIKRSILRMKHWWVPLAFNYQKSAAWLERTMDTRARMKLKMLKFKPVITLQNDQLRLSDAFFDEDAALRYIIKSVKQENQTRARKLLHIGVEYRGQLAYRHALSLKNKLQAACPRTTVTLHTAGSVTVYRLGTELIGVCVI